jgi:hypothetical protein
MSYHILAVDSTRQLIIRSTADSHNELLLADERDLLLLRARLNTYLESLQVDGVVQPPPPPAQAVSPDEMITADQARAEAAEDGVTVQESTLRMAIVRGKIEGAEKRGSRWWLPRGQFEEWLKGYMRRVPRAQRADGR